MKSDNFKELLQKAEAGDVDSQIGLGLIYRLGTGVEEDASTAEKWFGKAADQGSVRAMYLLGILNAEKENYLKAAELLYEAAEQGHKEAQFNLGILYMMAKA